MSEFVLTFWSDAVTATVDDSEIGTYVFAPDAVATESPKPYWHPLRALHGGLLTGYRPWDHRWHKGLQMTWTHLSGQNFWGGPTYVHGQGYVQRDNAGRMRHDAFSAVRERGDEVGFTETLTWITSDGEEWVAEERTHRLHGLDAQRGIWIMDFATTLRNIRGADLEFGSPTTEGRERAGYTGLFLRMPRAWTGGRVLSPLGTGGADELMGREAPWAAFSGQHDDIDGGATVIAYAGTTSGPRPIEWFVRADPIPVLAPSPAFHEAFTLADGEELRLSHRHVFLDRIWEADELAALTEELAP
jgi:hypothetical protein